MSKLKIVDENYKNTTKLYICLYFGDKFKEIYQITDGQRLFDFIYNNCCNGEKIALEPIILTDEQYAEYCRAGDELA